MSRIEVQNFETERTFSILPGFPFFYEESLLLGSLVETITKAHGSGGVDWVGREIG